VSVGPVDLQEELEDGPVGGPRGIEDDLDRLGMTRMVAGQASGEMPFFLAFDCPARGRV
jgi:hypothetical protein